MAVVGVIAWIKAHFCFRSANITTVCFTDINSHATVNVLLQQFFLCRCAHKSSLTIFIAITVSLTFTQLFS